jgi:hypothetical protein
MAEVNADIGKLRKQVYDYVQLRLGGGVDGSGMTEVELDPEHLQNSLIRAIEVFRTRSSAAIEESFVLLPTQKDVQIYTLPEETELVLKIWRRSLGDLGNAGSQIDPFSQGYLNVYILNAGRSGGLLSYELFQDFNFQVGRMFGQEIDFYFNSVTKKITLVRRPIGTGEHLLLQVYNKKPESQLLSDYRILTFIKEYTLALCKLELGEAREKFASIPGPSGGTTLNGTALKAEGQAMIDKLLEQITLYHFGEQPLGFMLG